MRMSPLSSVGAVLIVVGVTAAATGQVPPAGSPVLAGGSDIFRGVLARQGLRLVDPVEVPSPANTVVIVLGSAASRDPRMQDVTRHVLANGGAVLIAAEGRHDLADFFPDDRRPRLTVTGERVACDAPNATLAGNRWCVYPTPVPPPITNVFGPKPEWELFDGVTALATNVPSALRLDAPRGSGLVAVAAYPPETYLDGVGDSKTPLGADHAFAAAGARWDGCRCLIVADASVFANQMLALDTDPRAPDRRVDNLGFAVKAVRWLQQRAGGRPRSECVMFEDGTPARTLQDVPFARPPTPPVPPLPDPLDPHTQAAVTDVADRKVSEFEDANRFNKPFTGSEEFPRTLGWLTAAVAIGGAGWVAWKCRTFRPSRDGSRLAPKVLTRPPALPTAADAAADRLVLRDYVSGVFTAHGLLSASDPPSAAPPVVASGPAAGRLSSQLRTVWAALFEPATGPVSAVRLEGLAPEIEAVVRAAADGRWHRSPPPPGSPE